MEWGVALMLSCEGYKMFMGTATVTPLAGKAKPFQETGTWLYKPEADCWYVNGRSFPADIIGDLEEET